MKTIASIWAAIFAAILFTGCTYTVKPGADPLVVHAEQLAITATDSINTFVDYCRRNEAALGKDVLAARDLAATSGPVYIRELRRATKAYKGSRTTENGDAVNARMAALRQLLEQVREYYTK